jgi:hypothetical protein
MRNGRPGFLPSILKGILPLLGLAAAVSPLNPSQKSPWWEVRFALTVRGNYTVRESEATFAGDFTYKARWEGTMETDGPDVLLYPTKAEVQSWEIREKADPPGSNRVLSEKDVPGEPRLRVNYILRQDQELRLYFEVEGFVIPLHASPEKFELVLPSSREPAGEESPYDPSVKKGTNVVWIGEEDLANATLEKSFSWEWKRQHWAARDRGTVQVSGSHKATVVVTLTRH